MRSKKQLSSSASRHGSPVKGSENQRGLRQKWQNGDVPLGVGLMFCLDTLMFALVVLFPFVLILCFSLCFVSSILCCSVCLWQWDPFASYRRAKPEATKLTLLRLFLGLVQRRKELSMWCTSWAVPTSNLSNSSKNIEKLQYINDMFDLAICKQHCWVLPKSKRFYRLQWRWGDVWRLFRCFFCKNVCPQFAPSLQFPTTCRQSLRHAKNVSLILILPSWEGESFVVSGWLKEATKAERKRDEKKHQEPMINSSRPSPLGLPRQVHQAWHCCSLTKSMCGYEKQQLFLVSQSFWRLSHQRVEIVELRLLLSKNYFRLVPGFIKHNQEVTWRSNLDFQQLRDRTGDIHGRRAMTAVSPVALKG